MLLFIHFLRIALLLYSQQNVQCLIECTKSSKLSTTKLIRVTPQPNNGDEELIELRRRLHGDQTELWFQFQKVNFYYSSETDTFGRRIYPIERPISEFTQSKVGFSTFLSLVYDVLLRMQLSQYVSCGFHSEKLRRSIFTKKHII